MIMPDYINPGDLFGCLDDNIELGHWNVVEVVGSTKGPKVTPPEYEVIISDRHTPNGRRDNISELHFSGLRPLTREECARRLADLRRGHLVV